VECLKNLGKRVNLWDTQAVEDTIREETAWKNGYKNRVVYAYADWLRFHGFEYEPKPYYVGSKLPYVPLEKDIDQLIGGFTGSKAKRYAAMLQLAKESGWRPIEIFRLTPDDFDLERQMVTLNDPAKKSEPRQIKMSEKLTAMMIPLIRYTPVNKRVWSAKPKKIRSTFTEIRNRIAEQTGNPSIRRIMLRSFRHFKGTMTYHKTKDIVYTQRVLGHKNIKNTLIYIQLVNFETDDEYIAKVAKTLEDACQLVEAGFEYVTEMEAVKIFRKRK